MSKPWWQLEPMEDENTLIPSITFPALTEGKYTIARGPEGGYVLSVEKDKAKASTDLVVTVDKDGEVKLSANPNSTVFLQINDQVVEAGQTSGPLKVKDRVKLGDHRYTLLRILSEVAEVKSMMREVVQCTICLRVCRQPQLLRCGHTFCSRCLSQMITLAMNAPPGDQQPQFNFIGFADEQEILQQTRAIKCGVCRRQFSCWEANKAYQPIALSDACELMQKWIDFDENRPKCVTCHDARSLCDPGEYEYCERCKAVLCPVCTVEGHRDHELRDHKLIVAAVHRSGKRLMNMKMTLRAVRIQKMDLDEKLGSISDQFTRQQEKLTPPIANSVQECKKTLTQIEQQVLPFLNLEPQLLTTFDSNLKKSREKIETTLAIVGRFEKVLGEMKTKVQEMGQ